MRLLHFNIENKMSLGKLGYNQLMDDAYIYLLNMQFIYRQSFGTTPIFFWQMSLIYLLFLLVFTCYYRSLNWYMIYITVSMYVYVRKHTRVCTYFTRREGLQKLELNPNPVWPYGLCLKFPYTHFLLSLRLYTMRVFVIIVISPFNQK